MALVQQLPERLKASLARQLGAYLTTIKGAGFAFNPYKMKKTGFQPPIVDDDIPHTELILMMVFQQICYRRGQNNHYYTIINVDANSGT